MLKPPVDVSEYVLPGGPDGGGAAVTIGGAGVAGGKVKGGGIGAGVKKGGEGVKKGGAGVKKGGEGVKGGGTPGGPVGGGCGAAERRSKIKVATEKNLSSPQTGAFL